MAVVPAEVAVALPIDFAASRRAEMLANATAQVWYNVGDRSNWRVEVISGAPVPTIVDAAVDHDASLVIMGLGRHELVDRVFGTETALRVMLHCRVPVLAVPQNWIGIPRNVLVAVDFGPASLRAARTAMRIIAPGGSVCFAHVAPNIGQPDQDPVLADIYQQSLNDEFDKFIGAIDVPDDVTVTREALYGDTARALLERARATNVDMIVSGTHGLNAVARLLVGSVASKLVRQATCAVLVASAHQAGEEADGQVG